jgi:hypothetical protein
MNWRRGLFRLWMVGTALFVISVASISYSSIKAEFDAVASKPQAGPSILKPVTDPALIAQLEAAPSATLPRELDYDPFAPRAAPNPWAAPHPWAVPDPWASVGWATGIAFGIPLVVLMLGASLVWAFSGFAATTRPN